MRGHARFLSKSGDGSAATEYRGQNVYSAFGLLARLAYNVGSVGAEWDGDLAED